jgi:glycogen operon protein
LELRARQQRNLLATMLLSQGVPMILHGDELGRTQNGNNNGYCQDNELTWLEWTLAEKNNDLIEFTAGMTRLRRDHPVFRRRRFFAGRPIRRGDELRDIAWFTPDGVEMTEEDWECDFGRTIVVFLNGEGIPDRDARGERVVDDSFLLCFNAYHEEIPVRLPGPEYGAQWSLAVDTTTGDVFDETTEATQLAGSVVTLPGRSLLVLRRARTADLQHQRLVNLGSPRR